MKRKPDEHEDGTAATITMNDCKRIRWHRGNNHRWCYDPADHTYIKEWDSWYYDQWHDEVWGTYWVVWICEQVKPVPGERQHEIWWWDYA